MQGDRLDTMAPGFQHHYTRNQTHNREAERRAGIHSQRAGRGGEAGEAQAGEGQER